ncbi:hypothetical protein APSETT444_004887 [Aspergillus pseudonomiae]
MAFHKFRLEAGKRCPAPVPIAPAVFPRGQDDNVQHHSRQGAALQELSDENSFAPKCPVVVFPTGTTAALVRETKPLLFLSIISIASAGYCTVAQQRDLAVKARLYLADRAIVCGEKSIELVQALQVASFWYRAPDDYKQMNLNQLASIATTMAIDLGLDNIDVSKPAGTAKEMWDRAEAQRAWLGCLLLSARLSTSDMIALPPHIYGGRVIYAMILLLKIQKAITLSGQALSECITADELRVEVYLEHLVLVSKSLITEDARSALSRAFLVMPQLKQWLHTRQIKNLPGSDKTEMVEGLPFQTSDGSLSIGIQTQTATHIEPTDGLGQHIQPAGTSDYHTVHNGGTGFEPYRNDLASDSWFWEFFNVDMLHQNAHSS